MEELSLQSYARITLSWSYSSVSRSDL